MIAMHAGFHLGANHKHGRRGSVIGSATGILFHASAKFAEHHGHHAVLCVLRRQFLLECRQGVAHLLQRAAVASKLATMRVIATLGNVVHTRWHSIANQRGNHAKLIGDFGLWPCCERRFAYSGANANTAQLGVKSCAH